MMDGCGAWNDHASSATKRSIKIRNQKRTKRDIVGHIVWHKLSCASEYELLLSGPVKIAKSRIRLRVILRAGSALPGALSAQLIHRSHRSLPGLMTIRCWRPHGCRRASHRCDTKSSSQYCPGAIGSAPLSWRRANRPAAQQVRGRQEAEPSQQIPALAGRRDASQPDYASEARPLASVDRIPVASYGCDRRIHSHQRQQRKMPIRHLHRPA